MSSSGATSSKKRTAEQMQEDTVDYMLLNLDSLVAEFALLYGLSQSEARQVRLACMGRLLSLYSWPVELLEDIGLAVLPLVRLDNEEDARCSYGLEYVSSSSPPFSIFFPFPYSIFSSCHSCYFAFVCSQL